MGGQLWRLPTSTFVHIRLLHIAFNMWCLWDLALADAYQAKGMLSEAKGALNKAGKLKTGK